MSWKQIFMVFIGLRMLCWGSIFYGTVEILVSIYKYPPLDPEINQIVLFLVIISVILLFLILLDVLVIYGLKKEKRFYSRLFLLIVGFISFLAAAILLSVSIYQMLFSDYSTGYVFHRDQLGALLILITSIASIVIVFAKKIGKRKKSGQLAVPVDIINAEQEV